MPKVRAGRRKGWSARRPPSLATRMNALSLQDSPPAESSDDRAQLPTLEQFRLLVSAAMTALNHTGGHLDPATLLFAMFTLVLFPQSSSANPYWAYVPDPPMLHPTPWVEKNVPVYTNLTWALGGPTDSHINPVIHSNFSYQGQSATLPICFSRKNQTNGCVFVSSTRKSSWLPYSIVEVSLNNSKYLMKQLAGLVHWPVTLMGLPDLTVANTTKSPLLTFNVESCAPDSKNRSQPYWHLCKGPWGTIRPIPGGFGNIIDWSPYQSNQDLKSQTVGTPNSYTVEGLWSHDDGLVQTDLWRLVAAMGDTTTTSDDRGNVLISRDGPVQATYSYRWA